MTFAEQIEYANSRGVGQLHVFVGGQYARITHRSLPVALASAERHGGVVYNSDGELVRPTK